MSEAKIKETKVVELLSSMSKGEMQMSATIGVAVGNYDFEVEGFQNYNAGYGYKGKVRIQINQEQFHAHVRQQALELMTEMAKDILSGRWLTQK